MLLLQPRSWFCINYDGAAGDVDGHEDVDGGEDVDGEHDDLEDVGDIA